MTTLAKKIAAPLVARDRRRAADGKIDHARGRYQKAIKAIFEKQIASIEKLIEDYTFEYSERSWQLTKDNLDQTAKSLEAIVARMNELRPSLGTFKFESDEAAAFNYYVAYSRLDVELRPVTDWKHDLSMKRSGPTFVRRI
jgi:hypothetical protein